MINVYVLYRQGPYSAEGDIVVLCAYLGQLARVRDALASQVVVVIDERDQRELDDHEGDESGDETAAAFEHVKVTRRVSRLSAIKSSAFSSFAGPSPHC